MIKKTCALIIAGVMSQWALADAASVQALLVKNYPALNIEQVKKTEVPGIYSGYAGDTVVYITEDAEYVLAGNMIRLKDQENLTKSLMYRPGQVDWKALPFKDAVKTVRGTGKRQLAIFSDPNCPYCKQLEVELNKLNDVTIYTFILPLKPQSVAPSKQVFCEKDPAYAWANLIGKGVQPTSTKTCANPIERNIQLARTLGVNGTPAIIFADGAKMLGASPATEIEARLKQIGQ
ncbi:DsbC family protein [Acinetobacter cumulans]|uniref:Thiol:disulfide interchange protein n=1 Tax=Acinetobacter cumulans TaxID=2136182 RepID=A0A3A8FRU3_9GAMM|nr:DsbC family protein [Acinetobacter cumulans]RKG49472.1 DsbC family protein [Acinetobacter cumulans]